MRIRYAFALIGILSMSAALAADWLMRPGRWEITTQMDFGGRQLPPGMPLTKPMTSIACMTAEDVKKATAAIPPPGKRCKISDYKQNGTNISYTMSCEEMTMQYRATLHSPDYYSGTSTSYGKDSSQKMTMKFEGKRTGDKCSAKEIKEAAQRD
jgi:hypothetical protein